VFTVQRDFSVLVENHRTKALKAAREAIGRCRPDESLPPSERVDAYASCLSSQVNATLELKREQIGFERSVRDRMGERMAGYACRAEGPRDALNTSDPVRNDTWTYADETSAASVPAGSAPAAAARARRIRTVPHPARVLFESDRSAIVLVESFFSPEQCRGLLDAAATDGADGGGGDARGRRLPASAPGVEPLLAKIRELVLSYAPSADVGGGRDPAMVVHVLEPPGPVGGDTSCTAGAGTAAAASAGEGECKPSSSSSSSSSPLAPPSARRVVAGEGAAARLRVVCGASDDLVGGGVHYPRAGVHVNPAGHPPGHAVLAVYRDPATGLREPEDPYVEDAVECGVRRGRLVVVALDFAEKSR
jgi:hypothetical protein